MRILFTLLPFVSFISPSFSFSKGFDLQFMFWIFDLILLSLLILCELMVVIIDLALTLLLSSYYVWFFNFQLFD